jgi:hypothetical protein
MSRNTKSIKFSKEENAGYSPFTPRRTFFLTIDDPDATNREPFWALQVNFPAGNPPVELAVLTGNDDGVVNPIFVSAPGVIVPVCGIGVVASGTDINGNGVNTSLAAITEIVAFGGSGKTRDA